MVKIASIYDLFSLIVLLTNLYIIFHFDIIPFIGLSVVLVIHGFIKKLTTNLEPSYIFKRPDGATDCSLFNTGGLVDHMSGFPSGHMSSISFVMTYYFLKNNKKNYYDIKEGLNDIYDIIIYSIPIFLVGIARYMSGCHNLIQIFAGYILGTSFGFIIYFYESYISHYIDNVYYKYFN